MDEGGRVDSADGPREGPIILLFLVLTLAASIFVLQRAEANTLKDPKQKAARGEISGATGLSMVREVNLRKALAKINAGKYRLISNIRVAPDRVNASVRDKDGYRKYLTIGPDFEVQMSDAGVGEDYAVSTEAIDAAAPERMLKTVLKKTGLPPKALDYAATSFSENFPNTWYMAMKDGPARVRQWTAERNGTDVRKPGEPSAAQKKQQAENQRQIRRTQVIIQRRVRCINRAKNPDGIARCLEKYQP